MKNMANIASPSLLKQGMSPPSAWVMRWLHLIRAQGAVLDLACGQGRHAHALARAGHGVTAVDTNHTALSQVRDGWPTGAAAPECINADLENSPWPLVGRSFDAIVVTNYLWRPLWPHLLGNLAPGGVYIHETFAQGQVSVGKPSRPDFLLEPGELLRACEGLRVVAYEDGFLRSPERYIQRIVAIRSASIDPQAQSTPARHHLQP
jgi:SAM-dependent methyltransferase